MEQNRTHMIVSTITDGTSEELQNAAVDIIRAIAEKMEISADNLAANVLFAIVANKTTSEKGSKCQTPQKQ